MVGVGVKRGRIRDFLETHHELLFSQQFQKLAFLGFIIGLTILTTKDTVDLFVEYFDDPTISDFAIQFNETIQMPNVTFCMSKAQGMSHFAVNESDSSDEWDAAVHDILANITDREMLLGTEWDFRIVMEAYEVVAMLNSMVRETTAHGSMRSIDRFSKSPRFAAKRALVKTYMDKIQELNVTFAEFMQKTGTEVLRRSVQRFARVTYDEDLIVRTHPRITWISQMHMCFQPEYDADNFIPITDQGPFFTLMMSHSLKNLGDQFVDNMAVDLHGRPCALARFMGSRTQTTDGVVDELFLGGRHELFVELKGKYEMLENNQPGTACKDRDEDEDSEFDCQSKCRLDMIRSVCECTAVSLSYLVDDDREYEKYPLCDYTKCNIDVQRENYTDADCISKCYPDCTKIRFTVEHRPVGRMSNPSLTLITLNWRSFEYLSLVQSRKYTFVTFCSAVGGALGIWLGLSVLSFVQGAIFAYVSIKKTIKKKIQLDEEHKQSVFQSISKKIFTGEEGSGDTRDTENDKDNADPTMPNIAINPIPTEIAINPISINIAENPFADILGKGDSEKKEKEEAEC